MVATAEAKGDGRVHRSMSHLASAKELGAAAGVSYREVDYWTRTGRLPVHQEARGSGTRRGYNRSQVLMATMMARLIEIGFELALASKVGRLLANDHEGGPVELSVACGEGTLVVQVDYLHQGVAPE